MNKANINNLKEDTDSNVIIAGESYTPFPPMDEYPEKK